MCVKSSPKLDCDNHGDKNRGKDEVEFHLSTEHEVSGKSTLFSLAPVELIFIIFLTLFVKNRLRNIFRIADVD